MTYRLVITPEAEDNVVDVCNYYNSVQDGLSDRFLAELLNVYISLTENPQYFSFISQKSSLRDANIPDFPYVVIFDIKDHFVTIYTVFHTSRKPKFP